MRANKYYKKFFVDTAVCYDQKTYQYYKNKPLAVGYLLSPLLKEIFWKTKVETVHDPQCECTYEINYSRDVARRFRWNGDACTTQKASLQKFRLTERFRLCFWLCSSRGCICFRKMYVRTFFYSLALRRGSIDITKQEEI